EKIALENNQAMIGKVITVICDEADGRNGVGRSFADAPEIDNLVYFSGKTRLRQGMKYQVRINRAKTFDLYGEVC
ncbi:MAG: 30S ribosomal protein S12 methylthiotransferase RimO, partial [Lentisphaeria bacterium]|nr:30S ribosomal protein S12 methylthiotransferase RimO [Lentisphaeria bacterium]